jgi:hypothetical protein
MAGVALCQREWRRADAAEQNQVKRASNKMRFDGGVNLFFHFSSLVEFWERGYGWPFYLEVRPNVNIIAKTIEKVFTHDLSRSHPQRFEALSVALVARRRRCSRVSLTAAGRAA